MESSGAPRTTTVLVLPGLHGSGEGHWQTAWEQQQGECGCVFVRVQQRSWDVPDRDEWVAAFDAALRSAPAPVLLVAHSLGCALAVHHATVRRPCCVWHQCSKQCLTACPTTGTQRRAAPYEGAWRTARRNLGPGACRRASRGGVVRAPATLAAAVRLGAGQLDKRRDMLRSSRGGAGCGVGQRAARRGRAGPHQRWRGRMAGGATTPARAAAADVMKGRYEPALSTQYARVLEMHRLAAGEVEQPSERAPLSCQNTAPSHTVARARLVLFLLRRGARFRVPAAARCAFRTPRLA